MVVLSKEISLKNWHDNGERIIEYLDARIQEMTKLSKQCSSVRVYGSGTAIVGAIGITAGIALVPFTAGASAAIVSLCGIGATFLGGAINSGTTAYEMRQENAKADDIMAELQELLNQSKELLDILSENGVDTKRWKDAALASVQKMLPFAAASLSVAISGAHSALFQKNPTTSYFSPANKPETCTAFGCEVSTNTIANLCGVIAVLGAIYSMIESWKELEKNKRIKEGRTKSQFVEQLTVLRKALKGHLTDAMHPKPEQEEIAGLRHREPIGGADQ